MFFPTSSHVTKRYGDEDNFNKRESILFSLSQNSSSTPSVGFCLFKRYIYYYFIITLFLRKALVLTLLEIQLIPQWTVLRHVEPNNSFSLLVVQ
jgi:hypothetical protein